MRGGSWLEGPPVLQAATLEEAWVPAQAPGPLPGRGRVHPPPGQRLVDGPASERRRIGEHAPELPIIYINFYFKSTQI